MTLQDVLLQGLHGGVVFPRRVQVLARQLAPLLSGAESVLDLGCGDGVVGRHIMDLRPGLAWEGLDVHPRPRTEFPVSMFDGERIPRGDASVDVVLVVDVLHHTGDPVILLREAARVARQAVVLKDHLREGLLAEETLRVMDWVGNARHGVALPYNYWNRLQWQAGLRASGLVVDAWEARVNLYPWPASAVFGRQLHFVARLLHAPR